MKKNILFLVLIAVFAFCINANVFACGSCGCCDKAVSQKAAVKAGCKCGEDCCCKDAKSGECSKDCKCCKEGKCKVNCPCKNVTKAQSKQVKSQSKAALDSKCKCCDEGKKVKKK